MNPSAATKSTPLNAPRDMAAHFMECGALDTNLTLAPGARLVITDDLLNGTVGDLAALSMAAIVGRDAMVAKAAVLPLGIAASKLGVADRARYERLFALIEETAFDSGVRESAEAMIHSRFRENQIKELAAEIGGTVGPARQRYRSFLEVVKLLAEKKISEALFLDEFLEFTRAVAGKLDFGIYALCVDRLFVSSQVPIMVKASLCKEVCKYPPLVRKELITNLLSSPKADRELVDYARQEVAKVLTHDQLTEIVLFTTLKLAWAAQRERPQKARA
ncbi:hypothetical protein A6A05_04360 [Magnetospirillum moscoviense]|uniref:Uncharacterized protein n=2 Tax=Magnetospirillum moscoviense TaxID=1437059 RepID=A0A178MBF9_9PROT|nr:hypothetical protein [Alphaproteobacteria bacterium]OAN45358.1 hypothetical protein A6A05_04360 [Magnetospirillum moscoviense]